MDGKDSRSNGAAMSARKSASRSEETSMTTDETVEEGKKLFSGFLFQQIEREGLTPPSTPETEFKLTESSNHFVLLGQELNQLAEKFAKSKERKEVREKANRVQLGSLNKEKFLKLLQGVFSNGISRERIVVLFFFCSDVTINALQHHLTNWFQRLFNWTMEYIVDKICSWVKQHGGWTQVLSNGTRPIHLFILTVAFGIIVLLYRQRFK